MISSVDTFKGLNLLERLLGKKPSLSAKQAVAIVRAEIKRAGLEPSLSGIQAVYSKTEGRYISIAFRERDLDGNPYFGTTGETMRGLAARLSQPNSPLHGIGVRAGSVI